MPSSIAVKRLYDEPTNDDGHRLMVDGLWPRGIHRSKWSGRSWPPGLAPSRELRRWYRHDPERFDEFKTRYRAELEVNPEVDELLTMEGRVTLVTATRDLEHSHAVVLRDHLEEASRRL